MRLSIRSVIGFFALLLCAADLRAEERWYLFSIGGTPVGYVSEDTDGTRTRTVVFARLTRLGRSIEMRFDTTTVEDAAAILTGNGHGEDYNRRRGKRGRRSRIHS